MVSQRTLPVCRHPWACPTRVRPPVRHPPRTTTSTCRHPVDARAAPFDSRRLAGSQAEHLAVKRGLAPFHGRVHQRRLAAATEWSETQKGRRPQATPLVLRAYAAAVFLGLRITTM